MVVMGFKKKLYLQEASPFWRKLITVSTTVTCAMLIAAVSAAFT